MVTIIDKQTSDKISFISSIVPEFAAAYKMNVQDAFFYLKKYGGWEYLHRRCRDAASDKVIQWHICLYPAKRISGNKHKMP
ncbi:MAG: DUF3791 domain-containing protein [Tannerella sp.]|jgi:hypothetical protein|nr:DUF3791 domain-containing protein [Tannerella sp.]